MGFKNRILSNRHNNSAQNEQKEATFRKKWSDMMGIRELRLAALSVARHSNNFPQVCLWSG